MKRKELMIILLAVVVMGAAVWVMTEQFMPGAKVTRSAGKAAVGGPFTLTNHLGERVTEKTFAGKYMLVYFGYTFCPDVCPTELQIIAEAMEMLGDEAKKVTPVFITVDPARDNVEVMKDYVAVFDKRLVGLTGTPEEVKKAAKAYKVFYQNAKGDDPENYLVDHSSITFLMDRKGQYAAHFAYNSKPEKMADRIRKILAEEASS